jgi:sulfur carrier protein
MAENTTIHLNGTATPLPCPVALQELLISQGITPQQGGIAVAINGTVIPRTQWNSTVLQANDNVEIVNAFAGG